MATQAQRIQLAAKAKKDRSARIWAYLALFVFLSLSLAANVLTAWEYDIVAKIVAGVPPVSLFVTSMLFERMVANKLIRTGLVLVILVSLAFSWYHIAELASSRHQPMLIAWFLPIVIDVPMLFAGSVLINQAEPAKLPQTSRTLAVSTISTVVTTPAKRTSVATSPKSPRSTTKATSKTKSATTPNPATVRIPRKRTTPILSPVTP